MPYHTLSLTTSCLGFSIPISHHRSHWTLTLACFLRTFFIFPLPSGLLLSLIVHNSPAFGLWGLNRKGKKTHSLLLCPFIMTNVYIYFVAISRPCSKKKKKKHLYLPLSDQQPVYTKLSLSDYLGVSFTQLSLFIVLSLFVSVSLPPSQPVVTLLFLSFLYWSKAESLSHRAQPAGATHESHHNYVGPPPLFPFLTLSFLGRTASWGYRQSDTH